MILALHGAGERGSDGLLQTAVGIGPAIRSNRGAIEAIVVMPQCSKNHWWTLPPFDDLAMAALAEATKEFHGDTHRIYLTGLSMGGFGAWHLAEKYPGRFAALVVICGGIRPPAAALKRHSRSCQSYAAGFTGFIFGRSPAVGRSSSLDISWRRRRHRSGHRISTHGGSHEADRRGSPLHRISRRRTRLLE